MKQIKEGETEEHPKGILNVLFCFVLLVRISPAGKTLISVKWFGNPVVLYTVCLTHAPGQRCCTQPCLVVYSCADHCQAVYTYLTCMSLCGPVVKPDSIMACHQCRSLWTIERFNVFTLCCSALRLPSVSVQGSAGTVH
jgi:hypothetical protein